MKRFFCYVFITTAIILIFQCCGPYDDMETYYSYDIKIVNDTRYNFSVYLDNVFQFSLESDGIATIEDVKGGTHTISAKVWGVTIASRTINLNQDTEWTVSD